MEILEWKSTTTKNLKQNGWAQEQNEGDTSGRPDNKKLPNLNNCERIH